jgi:hypothetical protein
MRRRQPIPLSLGDVFTTQAASTVGLSRRRLEHPELTIPFAGVRMRLLPVDPAEHPGEAWRRDVLRLADAYRLVMDPREFFSHETAALIWNLPLPAGDGRKDAPRPRRVEASVFAPERAPRSARVTGHQVRPELCRVTRHAGSAVTTPATTWAMLADRLGVADLVAVGDAVVRVPRRPGGFGSPAALPLATIDQLAAAIAAGRRAGAPRLRAALAHIRTGSSSRPESIGRLQIVDAGLPEPVLDFDVHDDEGRFLGCSEMAYPQWRIAIEYEGDHHRTSRSQWNRDIEKYQAYAEAGWVVVRLTSTDVFGRPGEVVRRVSTILRTRGWPREHA